VHLRVLSLLVALPLAPAAASSGLDGAERVTLTSTVLGEERTLAIVTPASYAARRGHYPVLYLTDGDAQIGHTRATVEFLAQNELMPEMILVGILNTARTRDLTPTGGTAEEGARSPSAGGGERFLDFIEKELIPFIDARYRTEPVRVLAGHSFGGLLAIHALLTRPDLFQAVIAASPSLFWDDGLLMREAAALGARRKALPRELYFTLGEREASNAVLEDFNAFAQALKQAPWKDFRWGWRVLPEEDHGSTVLLSYYAGLRHAFVGWRFPEGNGKDTAAASAASVEAHFRQLSQRWGYTVVPAERPLNRLGYAALQEGELKRGIEIFRLNVALHPDSANAYDSLGEALERAGQLHAALESYRQAVVRAEKGGDPLVGVFRVNLERVLKRVGDQPHPGNAS
jgi:uncharacterized protein